MNFLAVDWALALLVGLQERDQARAADGDEGAVHVGRHLLGVRGVVRRVERREDPLGDVAAPAQNSAMKPAPTSSPKL